MTSPEPITRTEHRSWPPGRPVLACPECYGNLELSRNCARCPDCKHERAIDANGIVCFVEDEPPQSSPELADLLQQLRSIDSHELFKKSNKFEGELRNLHPDFEYDTWLNPECADWTIVGRFSDTTVLDLGGGYGVLARALANRGAKVVLVDDDFERLRFAAVTANLLDVNQLLPVHADMTDLPLRPESFDRVVLSRVWNDVRRRSSTSSELVRRRTRLVRNVRSLLRPAGELYLPVPNRFSPLGRVDDVESLYEQLQASVSSRLTPGAPVREHSRSQYESLLRTVGFRDVEVFFTLFDAQAPKFVFSNPDALANVLDRKFATVLARNVPGLTLRASRRFLRTVPTRELARVVPGFIFKARR